MNSCPICNSTQITDTVCEKCGFDNSLNYEIYPSLTIVNNKCPSISCRKKLYFLHYSQIHRECAPARYRLDTSPYIAVTNRQIEATLPSNQSPTISALSKQIESASIGIFVDYRDITIEQETQLRNELRKVDASYSIIKNVLARLACRENGLDFDDILHGTTAFVISAKDPIPPARIVYQFARQNRRLIIKGVFIEGKAVSVDELNTLSERSSTADLVSHALGTLLAPITSFALVLDQIRIQKESLL